MRVYKKKTIRRMKWYGVILVLAGIPLGIGMGRSLEEGRTFLLEESQIYDGTVHITGSDVNHIKNVLRMRPGEKILVSTGGEKEYHCAVSDFPEGEVLAAVEEVTAADRELPSGIVLFQGLPKGDKMELIIQKAVELGATEIVPVEMKRCVVKLDRKKAEKKAERWQTIALGAAKQSKRMQIPTVHMPVTFQQALAMIAESDVRLMPYENAEGMEGTRRILESIEPGESIAILIGPEGGIDEAEVEMAMSRLRSESAFCARKRPE